jgi:hypothetical protein
MNEWQGKPENSDFRFGVALTEMRNSDTLYSVLFSGGGGSRKLHNEKLHDLYSSPSIIRIIKSRRERDH